MCDSILMEEATPSLLGIVYQNWLINKGLMK